MCTSIETIALEHREIFQPLIKPPRRALPLALVLENATNFLLVFFLPDDQSIRDYGNEMTMGGRENQKGRLHTRFERILIGVNHNNN